MQKEKKVKNVLYLRPEQDDALRKLAAKLDKPMSVEELIWC
jgi:hypothetical protein